MSDSERVTANAASAACPCNPEPGYNQPSVTDPSMAVALQCGMPSARAGYGIITRPLPAEPECCPMSTAPFALLFGPAVSLRGAG